MRIRSMMEKEGQRGTKLQPFDLSEHSGNVAEAFEKFLRLYKCKYVAWDRTPPADVTDAAQWKGHTIC